MEITDIADATDDFDAKLILERLRESLRPTAGPKRDATGRSQPTGRGWSRDLSFLREASDVVHFRFTSHRRVLGPWIVLVKRMARDLLKPVLIKQVDYNQASARLIQLLAEDVASLHQELRVATDAVHAKLDELIRRRNAASRVPPVGEARRELLPSVPHETPARWLRAKHLWCLYRCSRVLVLGGGAPLCEALREAGVEPTVVDVDVLADSGDASIAGVIVGDDGVDVSPAERLRIVDLAHRKLVPGGVLIVEASRRPCRQDGEATADELASAWACHPNTLRVLLEAVGFAAVDAVIEPDDRDHDAASIAGWWWCLVAGRKSGTPEYHPGC